MRFRDGSVPETSQARDLPCVVRLEQCHCGSPLKPLVTGPFFVRWHDGRQIDLLTALYDCRSCSWTVRMVCVRQIVRAICDKSLISFDFFVKYRCDSPNESR